ncbi:MAG: hypothetical protein OEW58_08220 [Gammaproteobacteria bacterium]|nr:hypothetical protein [Gammaproteobacteria bacterium]
MTISSQQVAQSMAFDSAQVSELRRQWLELLDLSVWGEVQLAKIGALPRLRKRLLELGEVLAALVADRSWIPQPREQVKSALGTCVKLRDALLDVERSVVSLVPSADQERFERQLLEFRQALLLFLEVHELRWAALLDSQYQQADDE